MGEGREAAVDLSSRRHHQSSRVHEPNCLLEYMMCTGKVVEETGVWQHQYLDWIGGSPDCLVDMDGLVEVKCPFTKKVYAEVPPYYH